MLGLGTLARKMFGTPNDRLVKSVRPLVAKINALEPQFAALSDDDIKAKTAEFQKRVQEGGESLDTMLPEAFANCREAAKRALGLSAFDTQLKGGIFLHQGNIAEMKTGEGKTLVATFPAYLNALAGKGVHVVTVNDYLAKRDAEWMSKVYGALGLTTGVVYPYQPDDEKLPSYNADINEFIEQALHAVGILPADQSLYDPESTTIVHHVTQALRAHKLFTKDQQYIVRDGEVMLIDEFTGRMMKGRRLSDGLHQAIEAKEGVAIQPENVTLASVTFQNYFRLYNKLAGMTGTAATEADEFMEIYKLGVVEVPTNRPVQRKDEHDAVYRTSREKFEGIVKTIQEAHATGQPILVGTTSIDKSEFLSGLLTAAGIPHNVLNARQHEQEAQIVADAGKLGAVTIATNMAGRGTDIKLGGNVEFKVMEAITVDPHLHPDEVRARVEADHKADEEAVKAAGGLFVLATERHESRRIDNQLRGRSGRQGDPGRSAFFLSLEDDLMRIFGSERLDNVLSKLGMKEGEAIVHPWVNKSLERAQAKVEGRNF